MEKLSVLYDGDYWIDPLVKVASWSGDNALPYRTLTLTLSNTLNGDDQAVIFELGKEIRLYVDDIGIFRGVVYSYSVDDRGAATLIAYDENVYLTKNADTRKISGRKASQIIRELCAAFSIPVGSIADTGYVIPRLIFRENTLWDIIATALAETRKQNGRKFRLFASNGALNLAEKKDTVSRIMIEDGVNILAASRSQSIEDTRTSVKILGGDEEKKPLSASAKDSAMTTKYGVMQHIERANSDLTQSQLAQLAKQRLAELAKVAEEISVDVLGDVDVVTGTAVYAFESMTELAGGYYVTADTHTFEGGVHRMSLTLSRTDDLPNAGIEGAIEVIKTAKKKAKKKKAKEASATDILIAQIKRVTKGGAP